MVKIELTQDQFDIVSKLVAGEKRKVEADLQRNPDRYYREKFEELSELQKALLGIK